MDNAVDVRPDPDDEFLASCEADEGLQAALRQKLPNKYIPHNEAAFQAQIRATNDSFAARAIQIWNGK